MHSKPHRVDQQPNSILDFKSLILDQVGKVVRTISKPQSNSALSTARATGRASSVEGVVDDHCETRSRHSGHERFGQLYLA